MCIQSHTHMHVYRLINEYENIQLFMSIIQVIIMEIPHSQSFNAGCTDPYTGIFSSKDSK